MPSGASTGKAEAMELRDGDPSRYNGLGCLKAVSRVSEPIAAALVGLQIETQEEIDQRLLEIDGTPDKSVLGTNAILGTSIAFARALAMEHGIPLYRHLSMVAGQPAKSLPRLTVNLFSGGKHAGGQVAVQDVLLVPGSANTIADGLEMVSAVYTAAAELASEKYGMRLLTADEGGLAPPFASVNDMLSDTVRSIEAAALAPGKEVSLAMDVASSHFYADGAYQIGSSRMSAAEMIEMIDQWTGEFPIVSVEDGLAEDDWENWPSLLASVGDHSLVVGDDFLCTNPDRIQRAIDCSACNALLLKVNQIGTLTEALRALKLARSAGWDVTISARSGETEDCWLADLAVGWNADQIKVGSITQSERLAKYNRLLAIEAESGLPVTGWPLRE